MDEKAYHSYSRILHWTMALLLFYMIFLGWSLEERDTMRLTRFMIHKSLGITILALTLVRIGLRLAYKAPEEVPMSKWQGFAAKGVAILFYVLMIGLPISGWLMVSTSARPIPFFGLFEVPHLPVAQTRDNHELFETIHGLEAKLLIYGLIPLHILAALKHHFVDKDLTMSHMLPGLTPTKGAIRWLAPILVIVVALGAATFLLKGAKQPGQPPVHQETQASSAPESATSESVAAQSAKAQSASSLSSSTTAKATAWTLDRAKTRVTFSTSYLGEAIKGNMAVSDSQIIFSPDALEQSSVRISFDLGATKSGDADRDSALIGNDFFDIGHHPSAVFTAKKFEAKGKNSFVAKGSLTLRGKTMPLNLPFSLTIDKKTARLKATTTIDRLAYGVGTGEFAAPSAIPQQVGIDIDLSAHHD
jgi:cytochrome b561/polyisoprenoid-binding protein YceI